ncbi:MAG: hypothetical protein ACJ8DP_02650 [Microvirga sp.]
MRMLLAVPLLALAACQVTKDDKNDQVTIQYNEDVAKNAVADVTNGAKEAGAAIANSAEDAGATVRNVDVDVDLNKSDKDKAKNSN